MDEVAEESQRSTQNKHLGAFVFAPQIGLDSAIDRHYNKYDNQQRAYQALLRQRTEILTVGVAAVAGIGTDDGLFLRHLVRRVHELVGARSPAEYRSLIEQAEGRLPTVDALQIGSIGRNVGDGLDVFHKVA